MLRKSNQQQTIFSILYDKIPKKHVLMQINSVVDFSFINGLLKDSYCENFGRPAKEPEMMVKLCILQYLYNLSDVKVIEEANINLAYMWFLGINPEEDLPEASLLAKFRTQRLKDISLDEIIQEVVKQCIEKGIIDGKSISVDATHIHANTNKLVPERIMKRLAKKIFREAKEEDSSLLEKIDTDIPNYNEIEDPKEAKRVMKRYLEKSINQVQQNYSCDDNTQLTHAINKAKEVLNSPKFIEQKGIRSLVDEDARVGRKSKKVSFFGYKAEFTMLTEEKIITAIDVNDGSYVDGTNTEDQLKRTTAAGIEINEVYGDKAYFRKDILDSIKCYGAKAYIPVSEVVYKIDESKFSYNKDSDEWYCSEGNFTEKKKKFKRKRSGKEYEYYTYYFKIEQCKTCPKHDECAKRHSRKTLDISINTPEFYEISKWQQTDEFKEKYKVRAYHEGKNGEMKRFHRLTQARGYGLKSVTIQAKLTALAVNLKRIAKLVSSRNLFNFYKMAIFD